jgi:tetratricopeptide (TPR) repeat protein
MNRQEKHCVITQPRLFISYRRTQLERVQPAVKALEDAGIDCFLDVEDIDPLSDFPATLRAAIDRSHAMLVWWSSDYGESDFCLQEFRRGWQHARRHSPNVELRILVVNPEVTAHHIFAGELDSKHFLQSPTAGSAWAELLLNRLRSLLPEGPLSDERQSQPDPILYNVPIKSSEFTGRGRELMSIHSKLHPVRIGTNGAAVAVQTHGMAGVGKTELATAYARDFVMAYPGGVYWLNLAGWNPGKPASEHEAHSAWQRALEQAFGADTERARRFTRDTNGAELSPAIVREKLITYLSHQPDYLWVLENLPEISPLDLRGRLLDFIRAPTARGHTLLTTRDARIADGFAHERLDVLSGDDALRLLARFRPDQAHAELAAMRELVREVGAHTHALILLGEHSRHSPGGYPRALECLLETGRLARIEQIAEQLRDLLGTRARSIIATFALSIERLNTTERKLLSIAGVCAPNLPIPDDLLAAAFGGPEREDEFSAALGGLLRASLLARREGNARAVVVHPLVAEVAILLLKTDKRVLHQELADVLLQRIAKTTDIRPHAVIFEEVEQARILGECLQERRGLHLLMWVGTFDHACGRYAGACSVGRRSLELACRVLGEEHPDTLNAMNLLAVALQAHGDLSGARTLHEQVLGIRRRVLGEEHPETALSFNNLAGTLAEQGDLSGALMLQRKVLLIFQRVLGSDHPHTLTAMNNLAKSLSEQGDYGAAQALLQQVLPMRLRVMGENHPGTLTSMSNLAHVLDAQGEYAGARRLYERALSIGRRELGDEHPSTLVTMDCLAHTLSQLGDFKGARVLYDQVLPVRGRVLGVEHPHTLRSMNNLAHILVELGDFDGARALHEKSLPLHRRVLGDEHPDTLNSISNLAAALCARANSDLRTALALQDQVLSVQRRVLGEQHLQTLTSINNLAHTLSTQGDLGVARTLHEHVVLVHRRILGDDHPKTLGSMNDLAFAMRRQGNLNDARALYERILSVRRRVLPEKHPDTCLSAWNLFQCLYALHDFAAARLLLSHHLSWLLAREPSTLSAIQDEIRRQIIQIAGDPQFQLGEIPESQAHQISSSPPP